MPSEKEPPRFVEMYNSVEVPDDFITRYPANGEFHGRTQGYFNQIEGSLGLSVRALEVLMKKKHEQLSVEARRTRLLFMDVQPLADFTVLRTSHAKQIVKFSKYVLKPETIEAIEVVQEYIRENEHNS